MVTLYCNVNTGESCERAAHTKVRRPTLVSDTVAMMKLRRAGKDVEHYHSNTLIALIPPATLTPSTREDVS